MEEEKNSPPEYINQVQFTVQVHVVGTKWVQNFYEAAFKLLNSYHFMRSPLFLYQYTEVGFTSFLSGGSTHRH